MHKLTSYLFLGLIGSLISCKSSKSEHNEPKVDNNKELSTVADSTTIVVTNSPQPLVERPQEIKEELFEVEEEAAESEHVEVASSRLSVVTEKYKSQTSSSADQYYSMKFSDAAVGLSSTSQNGYAGSGALSNIMVEGNYQEPDFNTTEYSKISENEFKSSVQEPVSTFSIDVDNASYTQVRNYLQRGQLPPPDAVRIEEFVNYFDYDYPQPTGKHPFSINTELASCPWNSSHQLLHIGIQGTNLSKSKTPASNFVFLIDASGSMSSENKLPLLKKSLQRMLLKLGAEDRVAIVAYAGSAGLVLPSTSAAKTWTIMQALNHIESGGSTAGGQGIELAYAIAQKNFIQEGNNRVILATDGDFNVGTSSTGDLTRLIEEKRKSGVYLTITGFGMGNYKDNRMEGISNAGNGNYFYIDSDMEARKVFDNDLQANMHAIAKDVKIQIEFNPAKVKGYRLIGYENRVLANKDFNDDTKDAGELGAGHTVTALYEIVPAGSNEKINGSDPLKYQKPIEAIASSDLATVKFRYKPLQSDKSTLIEREISAKSISLISASNSFRFSASVAQFGLLLGGSKFKGNSSFNQVEELASSSLGNDTYGYRKEFLDLVKTAAAIKM